MKPFKNGCWYPIKVEMEKNITLKIDINMTLKEIKLFNLDLIKYIVPKFKKKFYTVELFKVFFFFFIESGINSVLWFFTHYGSDKNECFNHRMSILLFFM